MAAFSYTSRDFATVRADLLARAGLVFPEWTDRDPSDFGMLLVDLWAHAADVMHYYIDRSAGEAFIATATQRESILAVANLMDYTPRGLASATSTLTLSNVGAAAVVIPQYTEFVARYDSKTYRAFATYGTTAASAGYTSLKVTEGKWKDQEVLASSSNGLSGQRYSLRSTTASPESVLLFVYEDGITAKQYQQINRITDASTGDRVFVTYSAADGTTQVILGNNLNGFVPPAGSILKASYVESSGSSGNLPANSILSFSGVTPTGVSISSSTSFFGGVDAESIESLRRSIPSAISAQNRAVTRGDFVSMAVQVPGVSKAAISFVPGLSASMDGVGTNGSVTILPQPVRSDYLTTADTFQTVPDDMKTDIVSTIQPLALLGVDVYCASTITWQGLDVAVTVHVEDRSVQSWVKQACSDALDQLFAFDNVFFGQRMHLGQVYQILNNVAGVSYAIVSVFDVAGGGTLQTDILIDPLQLPKKGTFSFSMSGGVASS